MQVFYFPTPQLNLSNYHKLKYAYKINSYSWTLSIDYLSFFFFWILLFLCFVLFCFFVLFLSCFLLIFILLTHLCMQGFVCFSLALLLSFKDAEWTRLGMNMLGISQQLNMATHVSNGTDNGTMHMILTPTTHSPMWQSLMQGTNAETLTRTLMDLGVSLQAGRRRWTTAAFHSVTVSATNIIFVLQIRNFKHFYIYWHYDSNQTGSFEWKNYLAF